MMWVLYGLLAAFFEATRIAISKRLMKNCDEYVTAWATRFFGIPYFLIIFLIFGIPKINPTFWIALAAGIVVLTTSSILYMKAVKQSPLSLTMPYLSFTPLFLLLTSFIMLGEFPSYMGLIGVLLIVVGTYVLNVSKKNVGFLKPLKAIVKEKGAVLMLIVAFIYSIGANIDKIAITHSSPYFWPITINLAVGLAFIPIIKVKSKNIKKQVKNNYKGFFLLALVNILLLVFQMLAVQQALVSYAISLKRMSAVFSIFYGMWLFKEKNIRNRLIGAVIMVAGVLLITLF